MKRYLANVLLLTIAFVFSFSTLFAADAPLSERLRYLGSGLISAPNAYISSVMSYTFNEDAKFIAISAPVIPETFEVSVYRPTKGEYKNENVYNFKLALIKEQGFIPTLVYGMADVSEELGDRIHYVSLSKTLDAFALTMTAGAYEDPVDSKGKMFYSVDKVIFPLLTVMAERVDDVDAYGLRLSPYPGINLDYARRNKNEDFFRISFQHTF